MGIEKGEEINAKSTENILNKTLVRNSLNLRNELPTQETFRTVNRHTKNYPVHIIVWLKLQICRTNKPFRQLKENNDKYDVKPGPPEQQQIS